MRARDDSTKKTLRSTTDDCTHSTRTHPTFPLLPPPAQIQRQIEESVACNCDDWANEYGDYNWETWEYETFASEAECDAYKQAGCDAWKATILGFSGIFIWPSVAVNFISFILELVGAIMAFNGKKALMSAPEPARRVTSSYLGSR